MYKSMEWKSAARLCKNKLEKGIYYRENVRCSAPLVLQEICYKKFLTSKEVP